MMQDWPVEMELPIFWGDQDSFGHVNNVRYIRWFECVRIEHFMRLGDKSVISNEKEGPILARIEADYRLPLVFPDTILAYSNVSHMGNTSFTMEYCVCSKKMQKIACVGKGIIVMLDYQTGEKVRISDRMRENITALQGEIKPLLD